MCFLQNENVKKNSVPQLWRTESSETDSFVPATRGAPPQTCRAAEHHFRMGDDAPATPKRGGLFGNFGAMLESGGFMAAVGAVLKGHSMTEEQAVLLVQSHWRRHAVYVDNRTRQLAARHIQLVYMEREERRNRANMEALMSKERERQMQAAARTRAATKINMTWRGHLARNRARQLRRQKEGFGSVVRRSLSFGKKKGSARAVGGTLPAMPEAPPPSPGGGGGTAKRVMRSLSFGKKSSSSTLAAAAASFQHSISKSVPAAAAALTSKSAAAA